MIHNKIEIKNKENQIITKGIIISFVEKQCIIIIENPNEVHEKQEVLVSIFDDIEGIQIYSAKVIHIIVDKVTVILGDKINILQRRNHIKVKYEQKADIKSYLTQNRKLSSLVLANPIPITICDIGTGGIFFTSNEYIGVGQKFNLDLMYQGNFINLTVQIIRIQKMQKLKIGYGCKFVNLTKTQETFITAMVFKLQLK